MSTHTKELLSLLREERLRIQPPNGEQGENGCEKTQLASAVSSFWANRLFLQLCKPFPSGVWEAVLDVALYGTGQGQAPSPALSLGQFQPPALLHFRMATKGTISTARSHQLKMRCLQRWMGAVGFSQAQAFVPFQTHPTWHSSAPYYPAIGSGMEREHKTGGNCSARLV